MILILVAFVGLKLGLSSPFDRFAEGLLLALGLFLLHLQQYFGLLQLRKLLFSLKLPLLELQILGSFVGLHGLGPRLKCAFLCLLSWFRVYFVS